MIYFAHRGASAQAVQNTVSSFRLAQRQGATCYELDVHLLRDGTLAVHHDYSLLSTAGKDVLLKELTGEGLKQYPLINKFNAEQVFVPKLEEILITILPGLKLVNIEIKNDNNCYPGIEKVLLDTLQECAAVPPEKVLFSSFDYGTLVRLRNLNKNARIGLLTRNFCVSNALAIGAESVHMNQTRFSPEIARICHENKLNVYLYTVNDLATANRLEQAGADGIFTDNIDLFI